MNPAAAVIPRAAAMTTATLTVTRAVQITSKTSYVATIAAIVLLFVGCRFQYFGHAGVLK
jgi:hypothetical protein